MLAPILAFTADEAWEFVPGKNVNSVHESIWNHTSSKLGEEINWKKLFAVREECFQELEKNRKEKIIGKSLDAKIIVGLTAAMMPGIGDRKEELKEILNVSQLDFSDNPSAVQMMNIKVSKAEGQKCERCWHWESDIGQNSQHPTLCARCVVAVQQFKI
jgi:isoleucyl-tRNA synthetase